MLMKIIKRDKTVEEYNPQKIKNAIKAAFNSVDYLIEDSIIDEMVNNISLWEEITVEDIQDQVEEILMSYDFPTVAKSYILYREKHKEARFIKERIDYMNKYSYSTNNAASSSETDANANVSIKNVANLEGEVYKSTNRIIQRQRMKSKLRELFPEVAEQYEKDLNHHIIHVHDEATSPALKPYCMAVTLYPLMDEGTKNVDNVTPSAPNDIQSFSGQVTNLVFLLSSQCKGAVALGDYFIALNYYVIKEFGENWYNKISCTITSDHCLKSRTIKDAIRKGMKQFIYGINQPAGNRSYNSPFTNISFYDSNYFNALFEDFYYPDGTQPEWEAIDCLQRIFIELHRELRLIRPLTFPVTTMALLNNGKDIIDKNYKNLCAEEWALGSSFFCYTNNSPTALASCCRVLSELSENTFSSTTGMTGIMTGSCNVITLNLNRIIQDWALEYRTSMDYMDDASLHTFYAPESGFKDYLIDILERVYKYHIAYKTMLYDMEEAGMYSCCNAGYIYIKKLYSTIGIIGYTEAAKFLGLEVGNTEEYIKFLQLILGTIKDQNKEHSIKDKKRPFLFNSEAVPGEELAVKFYNFDKEDHYWVPEDQNLYNCYFYNPWNNTNILDKFKLHGEKISKYCDGGQALHANLDSHLSKEQYLKLLDVAVQNGTNYFTFNIPMSECAACGHIVNAPINECPICHSTKIKYWTRIIGYLVCVDNWSESRQQEFTKRVYTDRTLKLNGSN